MVLLFFGLIEYGVLILMINKLIPMVIPMDYRLTWACNIAVSFLFSWWILSLFGLVPAVPVPPPPGR